MSREFNDIATKPIAGDVVEFDEAAICPITRDVFAAGRMLRVIAFCEGLVWFKEYGKGRRNIATIDEWEKRLRAGTQVKLLNIAQPQ